MITFEAVIVRLRALRTLTLTPRARSINCDAPHEEILGSRGKWKACSMLIDELAGVTEAGIHPILYPQLPDRDQRIRERGHAPNITKHDFNHLLVARACKKW